MKLKYKIRAQRRFYVCGPPHPTPRTVASLSLCSHRLFFLRSWLTERWQVLCACLFPHHRSRIIDFNLITATGAGVMWAGACGVLCFQVIFLH